MSMTVTAYSIFTVGIQVRSRNQAYQLMTNYGSVLALSTDPLVRNAGTELHGTDDCSHVRHYLRCLTLFITPSTSNPAHIKSEIRTVKLCTTAIQSLIRIPVTKKKNDSMAAPTEKPADKPSTPTEAKPEQTQQKSATALEEDDEFEDFPVEDWSAEETESAAQTANGDGTTKHLWEESWDDEDTSDDFSTQLREELKKVEASKRR
ncbi:DSS1/SEM1 family-domain-containing protein [Xylaria nigripes]|nr:DSS1/SEM1 family-domain-containing protein [Xylaria nigripes]